MLELVNYIVARQMPLPPLQAQMYEYVMAANGVFVRGRREGLDALIPVLAPGGTETIRGLATVEPFVQLHYPRVSGVTVYQMLLEAWLAGSFTPVPLEILFHLVWEQTHWKLVTPQQIQTAMSVRPDEDAPSYRNALIEVHSHHGMGTHFSGTDNAEESGFRLYVILGRIFSQPTLRVRVGIYGRRWEIPARWIFNLPLGIADAFYAETR